jgi:DNA-binding transcriptional ArsR family regulator
MRKNTLKDMKNDNRRLLIKLLAERKNLSRIEMAHITGLSPSTVSSLTSELLEEGIVLETGLGEFTGGRKRTGLSLNGNFAHIAVAEIRRDGLTLRFYDMEARELDRRTLAHRYLSGDELFSLLVTGISGRRLSPGAGPRPLGGIGLLFQEDMSPGEFSVFYSTSLSSDTISLKDALVSRFHVPVIEEYSQSFSITSLLAAGENIARENASLVNIGRRISAGVLLRGVPVVLQNGRNTFNITPLVREDKYGYSLLVTGPEGGGNYPRREKPGYLTALQAAASALVRGLKPLCVLFQLNTVFLEGFIAELPGFNALTERLLRKQLGKAGRPRVLEAKINTERFSENLAGSIRNRLLLAD